MRPILRPSLAIRPSLSQQIRTKTSKTYQDAEILRVQRGVQTMKQVYIKDKLYDCLEPPPYPYGEARWYKQQNRGLYGGKVRGTGNNISERTETKTKRTFYPNIVPKGAWSHSLNRKIKLRMSTRVLRTIDKLGGLDEYLLGDKEARLRELGMEGWRLRWAVMMSDLGRRRMNDEAKRIGLPDEVRAERGWMQLKEYTKYMLEQEGKKPTDEEAKKDIEKRWKDGRATRPHVIKYWTSHGKQQQRIMVLREAKSKEDRNALECEEWSDVDDEAMDKTEDYEEAPVLSESNDGDASPPQGAGRDAVSNKDVEKHGDVPIGTVEGAEKAYNELKQPSKSFPSNQLKESRKDLKSKEANAEP